MKNLKGLLERLFSINSKEDKQKGPQVTEDFFKPDATRDVFLVTYPRSGTTWVSSIAAKLIHGISADSLTHIDHLIPDVHVLPKQTNVPLANRYLLKTHAVNRGASEFGEYQKVIYLIRDPRDVLLSHYRFMIGQKQYHGSIADFSDDWISGRIWPSSWQEHVLSWVGTRSERVSYDLDIFRYEDFIDDPKKETIKLVKSLGLNSSKEDIEEAIKVSSVEEMRKKEAAGNEGAHPDLEFIGKAKNGVWKEQFRPEHFHILQSIEMYMGSTMERFGYELNS